MVCSSGIHGTFPVFYFLAALAAFWLQAFSLPTRRRVVMARSTKVVKRPSSPVRPIWPSTSPAQASHPSEPSYAYPGGWSRRRASSKRASTAAIVFPTSSSHHDLTPPEIQWPDAHPSPAHAAARLTHDQSHSLP
ncbi:hypothetical protein HDK77DRAFT_302720 [Phyllosticta capitalensis]